eukprot:Colp12_sorted_trinity150504_noHs@24666
MARCFSSDVLMDLIPEEVDLLQRLLCGEAFPSTLDLTTRAVHRLIRAGAIVNTTERLAFPSPLAFRYFFSVLYPNRGNWRPLPDQLDEFITKMVGKMSRKLLQDSSKGNDLMFPVENALQHIATVAATQIIAPEVLICSEMSVIFARSDTTGRRGYIDWYINGDLHWGIEMLRLANSGGRTDHALRFRAPDGKYVSPDVKDHRLLNFTNKIPHKDDLSDKAVDVVFSEDWRSAVIYRKGKDPVQVSLSA